MIKFKFNLLVFISFFLLLENSHGSVEEKRKGVTQAEGVRESSAPLSVDSNHSASADAMTPLSSPNLSRRIAQVKQKSPPRPPLIRRLSAASIPAGEARAILVKDIQKYVGRSGLALEEEIEKVAPLCVEVTNLSRKDENTFYSVLSTVPPLEEYLLLNERIESKKGLSHHIFVFTQEKKEFCGCILLKGEGLKTLKNEGTYELKYAKNPSYKMRWGEVVKTILAHFNSQGEFLNYYAHVTPYTNYASYRTASSIMNPVCRLGGDHLNFVSTALYKTCFPTLKLGKWLVEELKALSTSSECRKGSADCERFIRLIEHAKKSCKDKEKDIVGKRVLLRLPEYEEEPAILEANQDF